jgi:hypothetical protein
MWWCRTRPVYAGYVIALCVWDSHLNHNPPFRHSGSLPHPARNRSGVESLVSRRDLSCAAIADQKIEEPRAKPADFTRLRSRAYVFARCHGTGICLNRPNKIQQKVTSEPGEGWT